MFDVFYSGTKPNLFAHEQAADSIDHARELSRTRYFWWVNYLTDYTGFDFLWEPVPWEAHQRHAWPSQWQKDSETYLVPKPGYTETNYRTDQQLTRYYNLPAWIMPSGFDVETFDFSWHPDPTEPPMLYQFGTQHQRTGGPQYRVPGAVDIKYVTQPRINKTTVDDAWTVPTGVDTASFDFTWHPDATDPPYIYQFGTQHQRTGGPQYLVPGATDVKYIDQIRIRTQRVATAVYEIDHMDGNAGHVPNTTKTVRYFDNYLDTLKRIAKGVDDEHEFVWICSSICDYTNFDFSWHPEQWQAGMLHVFASEGEKFGDTFFMHVPTFKYRSEKIQLLDWYDINFVETSVPRRPMPVVKHAFDTHVEAVKTIDWPGPLAVFTNSDVRRPLPVVPLWREKTKTIVPLSSGAEQVVVPKTAVPYIKTQLYDYPYIDKTQKSTKFNQLQDIVFISYDEPDADSNWNILKEKYPQAQRVHGVAGMELALEAAADVATTPWYFAVFAKTRLYENFDFSFVPDRMQVPKHYIFNARNTVNGLEYGHMGIVLYNSAGIRNINQSGDFGLDYTLSFPHESVPILSCYGEFDQTPYHTWRTAFRETAKLAYFENQQSTVEGSYRLKTWQSTAQGPYAEWCLRGANDGLEFFNTTDGQLDTLKQSFRWEWLRSYFEKRYGELK